MVLFFTSNGAYHYLLLAKIMSELGISLLVHDPSVIIYMGKDKVESTSVSPVNTLLYFWSVLTFLRVDEDLIKYAWPQDVWFHVDKLSSAHVYLRMPDGMAWDKIPEPLLVDCAQLVKANSIEGAPVPCILR